jgi:hypothetical protein
MKKMSVYLTTEEAERLRRLAVRERRSQAELIREGIRYVIGAGESRPRRFHSSRVPRPRRSSPANWPPPRRTNLVLDRLGIDAELAFIDDLVEGTFLVECLEQQDLAAAPALTARYRDLRIGLADASLVVPARRHTTNRGSHLGRASLPGDRARCRPSPVKWCNSSSVILRMTDSA